MKITIDFDESTRTGTATVKYKDGMQVKSKLVDLNIDLNRRQEDYPRGSMFYVPPVQFHEIKLDMCGTIDTITLPKKKRVKK